MNLPGSEDSNSWHLKDRLPCKWKRVDFKPRDLELLRILLEQKFLSGDQIKRYFFEGAKRYGNNRLWKLRRFEFVERVRGFHPRGIFRPTEKAYGYLKSQFLEVPHPVIIDPRTLNRDLVVTDIRFLFQKLGFGSSWTSERVWRMGRQGRLQPPDAVIKLEDDAFALEVICDSREKDHWEEIFKRYQWDEEFAACLCLADEKLMPLVLEKAKWNSSIYLASLKDLFEKKEKACFQNTEGSVLEIEENLERNLKPSPA